MRGRTEAIGRQRIMGRGDREGPRRSIVSPFEIMVQGCASQRRRDIEAACDIGGRIDLVQDLVCSDRSLGEVLQYLLRLRALDRLMLEGSSAVLSN